MQPIYYHKLWELLIARGMTQTELARRSGTSTATLARMQSNDAVSLNAIARICAVLECDLGDLVTLVPPEGPDERTVLDAEDAVLLAALTRYMEEGALSVYDVAITSGLARNTVKAILRGEHASKHSRRRLCKLGARFFEAVQGEPERKNAPSNHHGEAK